MSDDYEIRVAPTTDGGGRRDRVPDLSPREAMERWLNKLRSSKADSTVSAYHYQLKLFVEFCEEEGIEAIRDVTGWDIETYETNRREAGVATISLNKEFITLKQFLEYCARVDLVAEGMPEKVDPPEVSRDDQVDRTRLTPEAAQSLFDYYDEHDFGSRNHALLTLVWYTGCRIGGVRTLDLSDYSSTSQHLEFLHRPSRGTPLKNGRDGERAVGITDYVVDVLDTYVAEHRHDLYDDNGDRPLITSSVGRPTGNTIRAWMYQTTQPCLHRPCPHGKERDTCDWTTQIHASKCPSSRSPHQVRTGSITWQLNRGVPKEAVSKRVNTSVRVLERHYDQPTRLEDLEERRRQYVDRLGFEGGDSGGEEQ